MKAEISFDLVMDDDMPFVEGSYRLENNDWCVLIFRKSRGVEMPGVKTNLKWASGVAGLNVIVADDSRLNKSTVLKTLSEVLAVTEWSEVRGPDSMTLR